MTRKTIASIELNRKQQELLGAYHEYIQAGRPMRLQWALFDQIMKAISAFFLDFSNNKRALPHFVVERARIAIELYNTSSVEQTARKLEIRRAVAYACLNRIVTTFFTRTAISAASLLSDLPRSGRPETYTSQDRLRVVATATTSPLELAQPAEKWLPAALQRYITTTILQKSPDSPLAKISVSTVRRILKSADISPAALRYYLARKDPNYEEKASYVLSAIEFASFLIKKSNTRIQYKLEGEADVSSCIKDDEASDERRRRYKEMTNEEISSLTIRPSAEHCECGEDLDSNSSTIKNEKEVGNAPATCDSSAQSIDNKCDPLSTADMAQERRKKRKAAGQKAAATKAKNNAITYGLFRSLWTWYPQYQSLLNTDSCSDFCKRSQDISKDYVIVATDEKPGVQLLARIAPRLGIKPGKYRSPSDDYEYKRNGTCDIFLAQNLINGEILTTVKPTHKASDFLEWLNLVRSWIDIKKTIILLMDNSQVHLAPEVKDFLLEPSNKFEVVFTPTHASWLDPAEGCFSKVAKQVLDDARVPDMREMERRVAIWTQLHNRWPKPVLWKYGPVEFKAQCKAQ
jgi:hypothetical protein